MDSPNKAALDQAVKQLQHDIKLLPFTFLTPAIPIDCHPSQLPFVRKPP